MLCGASIHIDREKGIIIRCMLRLCLVYVAACLLVGLEKTSAVRARGGAEGKRGNMARRIASGHCRSQRALFTPHYDEDRCRLP